MVFLSNVLFMSFAVFYLTGFCQGKSSVMGRNADIIYKYTEKCPKQIAKADWNFTIQTSKLSRTKTQITFNILAKEPIDDSFKCDIFVAVWTNAGWKPNFFHFVLNNLCTTLKTTMKKVMNRLASDSNFTAGCPIPKGPLRMNNFFIDTKDYGSFPMIPYSKLRATTMISKGNTKVVCTNTYVEIE